MNLMVKGAPHVLSHMYPHMYKLACTVLTVRTWKLWIMTSVKLVSYYTAAGGGVAVHVHPLTTCSIFCCMVGLVEVTRCHAFPSVARNRMLLQVIARASSDVSVDCEHVGYVRGTGGGGSAQLDDVRFQSCFQRTVRVVVSWQRSVVRSCEASAHGWGVRLLAAKCCRLVRWF